MTLALALPPLCDSPEGPPCICQQNSETKHGGEIAKLAETKDQLMVSVLSSDATRAQDSWGS